MRNDWDQRAEDGDGLFAIACAIQNVASAIDRLGNGDAATTMGAIEAFGKHLGEKLDSLTDAISNLGDNQ